MGAWGIRILENDTALDEMQDIIDFGTTPEAIQAYTVSMLNNWHDEHIQLLAIGIIDASLNGAEHSIFGNFQEYNNFLLHLEPMEKLRDRALKAVKHLGVDRWSADCKDDRQHLYDVLVNRLTQEVE